MEEVPGRPYTSGKRDSGDDWRQDSVANMSSKLGKDPVVQVSDVSHNDEVICETTPLLTSFTDPPLRSGSSKPTEGDEESQQAIEEGSKDHDDRSVAGIISVLLIGVFISQADSSLMLATYGRISSEFNDLESGSWLMISYMLAQCVAQPFYGKLSDIFGRKLCLQVSYTIFTIGTLGIGMGQSLFQVSAARAMQGCGGAGMVCMVSIILTDLLPVHEVAVYRSYVNIMQTAGRSCGGAIGGLLAQTIGWRWAFLGQCPIVLFALWLVGRRLPASTQEVSHDQSMMAKLRRIDVLGAIFMSLTISSTLLVLDLGGQKFPWSHPIIIALGVLAITSGAFFILVEKFWADEPLFPLHIMTHYAVVNCYAIIALQNLTQSALMVTVPLYWQVVKKASMAEAGLYLIPAIVGNTLGGLQTGRLIKKYGRYKIHLILASLQSMVCFASLIGSWDGHSNFWSSLLIFSGGFGTGIAHSAVFVALANGVAVEDTAIASSGFYLSGNIGLVSGISAGSAIYQVTLRRGLCRVLEGRDDAKQIIEKTLQDIDFVQNASDKLRQIIVPAYVASFRAVFALGLACAGVALVFGVFAREKRLEQTRK